MAKPKPSVDLGYPNEGRGGISAFNFVEEEAEWWDTHDSEDYPDAFTPVEVIIGGELLERLTLRLDEADREALNRYARKKGVGPSTLARMWIKEHLAQEAEAEAKAS